MLGVCKVDRSSLEGGIVVGDDEDVININHEPASHRGVCEKAWVSFAGGLYIKVGDSETEGGSESDHGSEGLHLVDSRCEDLRTWG